ncbi:hypothetical protein JCM14076_22340 [Methylosoma difficile]
MRRKNAFLNTLPPCFTQTDNPALLLSVRPHPRVKANAMIKPYFSVPALALSSFLALPSQAADSWSYQQQSDPLTNQSYSYAQSPRPDRSLYDNIKLQIVCKQQQLQVVVETESLIASQNSPFVVEYQIDQQPALKMNLTTFADSKRKGFNQENAKAFADSLLTGQKIFIRINTLIKKTLSSEMLLTDAAPAIGKVLGDCGLSAATASTPYSLAEFEQAFAKLPPEQQQNILVKLKKIITEGP